MAEWVINYHGGFGRRGLLGEILAKLSFLTDIYLKDIENCDKRDKLLIFHITFMLKIYIFITILKIILTI